jgi:hypothetical protein
VAVEEDGHAGQNPLKQWGACAELVDEKGVGFQVLELGGEEADLEDEDELSGNGAEDGETTSNGCREPVPSNTDIEGA